MRDEKPDERWKLDEEESQVKEELMRLALAQNPHLAQRLLAITARQNELKNEDRRRRIALYFDWLEEQKKNREPRKIRYDDRRNINALNGLRRRCDYKWSSRLEQIEMEIKDYYEPNGITPPAPLVQELERLKNPRIEQSMAG